MVKKIVKIGASWCGPCKVLNGTLNDNMSWFEENDIEVKFVELDGDEISADDQKLIDEYRITSIPTMLLFDENNMMIDRLVGGITIDTIKSKIEAHNKN